MSKIKPLLWLIFDGLGEYKDYEGNAFTRSEIPNMNKIFNSYPHKFLKAAGLAVGLPEGQIGNSEVGHMNMGAGRTLFQGLTRINIAVEKDSLKDNETFKKGIEHLKQNPNAKLHIMGLASFGGVHSNLTHILGLVKAAHENGIKDINVHGFGDGRDVAPDQFVNDIPYIEKELKKYNAKFVSLIGRYYAMDRDKNFDRTMQAYNLLTKGEGEEFENLTSFVKKQYENNITDEFFKPGINKKYKDCFIVENDLVIFANFRPDRARQLSHLFFGSELYSQTVPKIKNLLFLSMMHYDGIECQVLFEPIEVINNFGETISKVGLKQLRTAETEKYAHVTFFFNGGKDVRYKNEDRLLIDSPKVATYDLLPIMSATKVTDAVVKVAHKYDVIIMNYANPDMVGHTGNLNATIQALTELDKEFIKLYNKIVKELGGVMFITADHGNCEQMIDKNNKPITAHTTNDVPFIITDNNVKFKAKFINNNEGKLGDVAPTILKYLNIEIPKEMEGDILIE